MKPVIQKVIVGGAVLYKGKVLIVQRSADEDSYPNVWELPGGNKDKLEPVSQTVLREVKEEAGLETKIVGVIDVFNFTNEKENEIRDATQINFLLEPTGRNNVVLSNEHQNYAWITKSEIDKYDISEEIKSTILKAFI